MGVANCFVRIHYLSTSFENPANKQMNGCSISYYPYKPIGMLVICMWQILIYSHKAFLPCIVQIEHVN